MAHPPYDPYGGYGQDPYAQYQQPAVQHHYYGGGPPPMPPRNNGMAIASMVLGIIGVLTCGGVIFSAAAIIFGHVSQGQIKRTGENGSGMAVTGLVLGYIFALLGLLYWCLVILYGVALWNYDAYDTY